jgi:hypothetical protein
LFKRKCKKFGKQAWMCVVIVFTELLIVLKFAWDIVTKPLPTHMVIFWTGFLTIIVLWTIWHFYIKAFLHWNENKINEKHRKKTLNKFE